MTPFLARSRRRGAEILDDPQLDPALRVRSLADVTTANRLLGGSRAVIAEFADIFRGRQTPTATLLDVGPGLGDMAADVQVAAARASLTLTTVGVDAAFPLAVASRTKLTHVVCGDGLALPVPDQGVDLVLCSQLLHHFDHAQAVQLLRELDRVARVRVVIGELRRSVVAAAGLWLLSYPLRFHRVSRHDGVLSVMRGFTSSELAALIDEAVGVRPPVRRRLGWRLTASWTPRAAPARPASSLGPLPTARRMRTVDERVVRAPLPTIFELAADVERWPQHLRHYRYVRFHERDGRGGGIVEMAANRPFGPLDWPTWWKSEMAVVSPAERDGSPRVRFRHVGGITTGMDVEWSFEEIAGGTHVRIVHVWNGPRWPLIGGIAATGVIGPVFVHGIASRTLAGLAAAAERIARLDRRST